jgi:hypothetical protein
MYIKILIDTQTNKKLAACLAVAGGRQGSQGLQVEDSWSLKHGIRNLGLGI